MATDVASLGRSGITTSSVFWPCSGDPPRRVSSTRTLGRLWNDSATAASDDEAASAAPLVRRIAATAPKPRIAFFTYMSPFSGSRMAPLIQYENYRDFI